MSKVGKGSGRWLASWPAARMEWRPGWATVGKAVVVMGGMWVTPVRWVAGVAIGRRLKSRLDGLWPRRPAKPDSVSGTMVAGKRERRRPLPVYGRGTAPRLGLTVWVAGPRGPLSWGGGGRGCGARQD